MTDRARQDNKRKKSHKNVKRQPGSLKVWLNEKTGDVHLRVNVHNGRVTRTIIGPEAGDPDTALQFLTNKLKEGV